MVIHPQPDASDINPDSPEPDTNRATDLLDAAPPVETVGDDGEEPEPDPPLTLGNESDDDASVEGDPRDDPQDDTLGSFDTAPIIVTDRTGEFRATDKMCRVILSSRSPEGQALFCGNSAHLCTRRTHQVKQSDGSDRAAPGVYEGILNSSQKIVDGIVESSVSFEDRAAKSKPS
jgi:hypothetical protein